MQWFTLSFDQLTTTQLYDLLKLRSDVFVVEQDCVYPDLDDKDRVAGVYHLLGYQHGKLIAYIRLLPARVTFDQPCISRVVTHPKARGNGIGHRLLNQALAECRRLWPEQGITISAQQYLESFYTQHGFEVSSEGYLEDGIPHIQMKRPASEPCPA
ncbi:GNAT family N-acetyltransferase [Dongshaea marina]|uniref:GNAT family N-acetyltransferase n=1 Tax=Dongshaea marina TaxID=2047966 RepID=UPI000D3EDB75|nr:GNAT family N-acetyltransferase [Dongshaea marina]